MVNLKYKLVRAGRMAIHRSEKKRTFYRVQAVRAIPEHNVKAGDLGGYVTHKEALSQGGSCWIGEEAQVIGDYVRITEDAYIGGTAIVQSLRSNNPFDHTYLRVSGHAKVTEEATVFSKSYIYYYLKDCIIKDSSHIYGKAKVHTVALISGGSKIHGSAEIHKTQQIKNSEIYQDAIIAPLGIIENSSIYGNAKVGEAVIVRSSAIFGDAVIIDRTNISQGTIIDGKKILYKDYKAPAEVSYGAIFSADVLTPNSHSLTATAETQAVLEIEEKPQQETPVTPAIVKAYREVCEGIDSYRTDVVKIIKYPVMTDQTDEHTLEMMMALKTVQRLEDDPSAREFREAVIALEKSFMKAESNARKVASSLLSDVEKKKTEKAKDMFRIAADEVSSEQEKKVAFIQGFKQLEGILDVPDVAVDTFRLKIGLKELEM